MFEKYYKQWQYPDLNVDSLMIQNSTMFLVLLGGIILAFAIAYVLSDATGLNDLRRTFETYDFFGTSEVTSDFSQYQTRYKRFATNGKV